MEMLAMDVADLVVALFIVYGAVVAAVVYGFLHAIRRRQRSRRIAPAPNTRTGTTDGVARWG